MIVSAFVYCHQRATYKTPPTMPTTQPQKKYFISYTKLQYFQHQQRYLSGSVHECSWRWRSYLLLLNVLDCVTVTKFTINAYL